MAEKVVFDTNIRLAALLWRGAAYKCWLAARAGLVEIVYCREMLAEFSEKLYEKFGFSADNVRAAVYDFRRFGQQVEITGDLRVVSSDPDDDMFVECALVAGASMIVSGDHHLLDLEEYKGIRIVTPAAFLRWLVESS
ncbi:MAG: putative toxin-antitoxin system toxin component, PIN family [Anaerolineae bacterium]